MKRVLLAALTLSLLPLGSAAAQSPPYLWVNEVSAFEGNSGTTSFTFTVGLSEASAWPVPVLRTSGYDRAPGLMG